MYTVGDVEFNTFQEVIDWAHNTHRIEISYMPESESQKHEACEILHDLIIEEES